MFGRQPRTRFDLLQQDLASKVSKKQEQQKSIFGTHTKDRNFSSGGNMAQSRSIFTLVYAMISCGICILHSGMHSIDWRNFTSIFRKYRVKFVYLILVLMITIDDRPLTIIHP